MRVGASRGLLEHLFESNLGTSQARDIRALLLNNIRRAFQSAGASTDDVRSNIMQRFPEMRRAAGELRAIIQSATPFELGLCGTLSTSGARPAISDEIPAHALHCFASPHLANH